MASSGFLFLLCTLYLQFVLALVIAQQPTTPVMLYHDCVGLGNYTTNSTYQANLNNLLPSIYNNTEINYGFYNFSYGENSDTVYAIALCRPDVSPDTCRSCIRNASDALLTLCPNNKEAIGGYDYCMLRYTFRAVFNLMEVAPYFWGYRDDLNVSDFSGFNLSLNTLLSGLWNNASMGDSRYKYAVGQNAAPNFQTIYALVQCTPDLSASECRSCLYNASGLIPRCCDNRAGGKVIFPSCNFRYEINRFYEVATLPPPTPTGNTTNRTPTITTLNTTNRTRTIIIIAVVVPTICSVIFIIIWIILRKRNKKQEIEATEAPEDILALDSLQFDFEDIKDATNNFSEANKLGQGGFGAVYKGILPNGQYIAVKRLCRESQQGEVEFKNEILLVANLQHKNLVRLHGFCFKREERLLVYEFVSNSSLDKFIFDPLKREHVNWETRYKITGGIARGLLYLHEDSRLRIVHRDLKASNILLDEDMNPKISDFGMARLFAIDQTQDETNRIVGTFGYMAPEYITRGHFSVKSDVFSFGVLVLEIVSGHKNSGVRIGSEQEDLLTYAWRNWNDGSPLTITDPKLRLDSTGEIIRCIHIGLLCVQEQEVDRPTMAQVAIMLSSHSLSLPVPSKPAFFMHSRMEIESNSSLESDPRLQSRNEVSISDVEPR